jgi:hypothetical protein
MARAAASNSQRAGWMRSDDIPRSIFCVPKG